MPSFLLGRLISALIVVLGVIILVFLLIHLIPGDPVEVMLGESAQAADREALRESLGLNKPLPAQLSHYLIQLSQFDLGISLHSKRAISEIIAERFPATLQLALVSMIMAIVIALPLGIIGALHQGKAADSIAMGFAMIGVSIPNFVMGPLLILLFSVSLGWLPVSGKESVASMILPALTLGTAMAAILSRMVRASLLEILNEDYIRTARAKGLSEKQVILKHALRNASLPLLTVIGLQLGTLLGGAVITEMIFPGPESAS
jgi:peptide/nickel transport system permease protein